MTQELLDKIYNETLNKPSSFHYLCYGGGNVKMVDKHTNEKTFTCKYQGDKNWLTPACEKCTGLTTEDDSDLLFHECPNCNCRCNCTDQPCSCCNEV
jgi:hypothetical protein